MDLNKASLEGSMGSSCYSTCSNDPLIMSDPGLLTGIECSRVRDSSWMYLISFVTTLIGVVLAAVQENYPIVL